MSKIQVKITISDFTDEELNAEFIQSMLESALEDHGYYESSDKVHVKEIKNDNNHGNFS